MHSPDNRSESGSPMRANWDDLRYVLAVAEHGSVSAAARALGVNHATVLRRIAAFEAAHGAPIFDRGPHGYAVPPDRLRVIEAAREAAAAIDTVNRLIRGAEAQISGTLRITSTDSLCVGVLPEIVAGLQAASAGLRIDLISTNAHLDLGRLGADITVRPALRLPDDMRGEQAGVLGFAVYAAPKAPDIWLGLRGALQRAAVGPLVTDETGAGSDSFVVLRELAAQGLGRAILPCCLGEPDARLRRVDSGLNLPLVPLWVASHPDLADSPRLSRLRRRIVRALRDRASLIAGPMA